MSTKLFKAVILGAPASGKGTISSRIVKTFDLEHISSGDKLRLHLQHGTPLGLEARKYINEGRLVPDKVMLKFMSEELSNVKTRSWLLDGFPRTVSQAEKLWQIQALDAVINLTVPFSIIIDRVKSRWVHLPSGRVYNIGFNEPKVNGRDDVTGELLEQRPDDKPQNVKKRLEIYDQMTKPVIEFYRKNGILHDFQGNTSDEIWPQVKQLLNGYPALSLRPPPPVFQDETHIGIRQAAE